MNTTKESTAIVQMLPTVMSLFLVDFMSKTQKAMMKKVRYPNRKISQGALRPHQA
jgi:hypothetical protein